MSVIKTRGHQLFPVLDASQIDMAKRFASGPAPGGNSTDGASRSILSLETSRPGVFAIGDVRAGSTKRVAAAVGEGAAVVPEIHLVVAAEPG